MKLDPDLIHYLTKEHFRVLTAVEMGMKNHEYVPVPLIESLAALKRGNTYKVVQFLLKHKLVMHMNKQYDGYALTYGGYDYLALKAFMKRGHIKSIGIKIGVGKESDIYLCHNNEGDTVVVKFARLGRTSFRTVKDNRDYLKGRSNYSWLYLSRIASLKEYAFMKALHSHGFPTPVPIDSSRHAIVMSHIRGYPLTQIKELGHPKQVYEVLLEQLIRLAEHGLVHGDFNEFNLLIDDDEKITIIDFPQMTSTAHPNAQFYFSRDVVCVQEFFAKRFGLYFSGVPELASDIEKAEDLDKEIKASGFANEEELKAMENIHEHYLDKKEDDEDDKDESSESEDDDKEDDENERDRKVRFQEISDVQKPDQESSSDEEQEEKVEPKKEMTDEQKDEASEEDEDSKESDEEQGGKKEERPKKEKKQNKEPKTKLVINEDYVKDKVKKQFWNKERKQVAKRNKNKDKKVMKAQETIKDYFLD